MKNALPKIILLTAALGVLIALITVMLKNKETVKAKGKAVASKLHAKRKPAETVVEPECGCCCDEVDCDCDCGCDVEPEAETKAETEVETAVDAAEEAPLADENGCECGDAE